MEGFWKAAAILILTVVLGSAIGKTEKDLTVVLSLSACCIILMVALQYLSDVLAFLWELGNRVSDRNPFTGILMRIAGVSLVTEVSSLLSSDTGNSSLGKAMQILGNSVILFLSLPILEAFLTVIQEIMGCS